MPVLVAFSVVGVDMAASSRRRMLGEAPVARLARIKGSRDSERHAEAEEPQALGAGKSVIQIAQAEPARRSPARPR